MLIGAYYLQLSRQLMHNVKHLLHAYWYVLLEQLMYINLLHAYLVRIT